MACLTEGIYLIHIREFIITNKNIFKLGRSHNIDNRMGRYPKGSSIIAQLECCNSVQCEKELLVIFKSKFVQQKYYGIEYFEGYKYDMMDVICNEVKKFNNIEKEKLEAVKKVKEIEKLEIDRKKKEEERVKASENDIVLIIPLKDADRTCPKCNTIFKYPSFLKTHLKESARCKINNDDIVKYFDNVKNKINSNPIQNSNDIDIKQTKCNNCGSSFTRNSSINLHNKISKCGKLQKLKLQLINKGIGSLTINELNLIRQEKEKIDSIKQIKEKEEKKKDKEEKEKIINLNLNNKIININADRTCTKCKTIFKYPSFLQTHMKESARCKFSEIELTNFNKTIEESKDNKFTCNHCKISFTRNATLIYHNKNSNCGKSQQIITKNVKQIIITKKELDNITLEDAKQLIRNHNFIH